MDTNIIEGDPVGHAEVFPPAEQTAVEQGLEFGEVVDNDGSGEGEG